MSALRLLQQSLLTSPADFAGIQTSDSLGMPIRGGIGGGVETYG